MSEKPPRCPRCGMPDLRPVEATLRCTDCGCVLPRIALEDGGTWRIIFDDGWIGGYRDPQRAVDAAAVLAPNMALEVDVDLDGHVTMVPKHP